MRQVEPMLRHYNVRRITPKDFMRIITVNLNGIRSAAGKGFYEWLAQQDADIVCLQGLKAQEADMTGQMLAPLDYHGYFHYAEKKGYSGVGIYCRERPQHVVAGLGIAEFDAEGRYLCADFAGFSVVSVYLPSGSSGEERQEVKFKFMTGFLPEERAWLTGLFDEAGFVDVFRRVHPELEAYTWWSNRGQAWAKDVGWRIDYQIATPGIAARAEAASIYKAQRFSDHAPLIVDYL